MAGYNVDQNCLIFYSQLQH